MINNIINEHIDISKLLMNQEEVIHKICDICLKTIKSGKKIMLCGNGGSASDSIHIAAELVGRFEEDRNPYSAVALTANPANLTAIANDYGFNHIFARQIEAIGEKGDALIALSTSGNSKNILNAIEQANNMDISSIGLTGDSGGKMSEMDCKQLLMIESSNTARIQEMHILIGHIICEALDNKREF